MTEISSLMQNPILSQGLGKLQSEQDKLAKQAIAGKKTLSYQDLEEVSSWAENKRIQNRKQGFLYLNKSVSMRLESYGRQMTELKNLILDISEDVRARGSVRGQYAQISEWKIRNWLNKVYYILNSRDAFGFIFGENNPLQRPMTANSLGKLEKAPEPPTSLFTTTSERAKEKLMPQSPETIYGISSKEIGLHVTQAMQKLLLFIRGKLPQGVAGTPGKLEGVVRGEEKDLIHKVLGDLDKASQNVNRSIGRNVLLKKLLLKNQTILSQELDQIKLEEKKQELDMVQLMKDIQEYKQKVEASTFALKTLMNTDLINIMKD